MQKHHKHFAPPTQRRNERGRSTSRGSGPTQKGKQAEERSSSEHSSDEDYDDHQPKKKKKKRHHD